MAVRTFRLAAACFATLLSTTFLLASPASAQVRISQVYGGGGNSGATYKNDFIELFNAGTTPVSLGGWSVQYASATGTSWALTALPNTTLQPGQYFLVQQAAGAGTQPALPTPDATGTLAMGGAAGKVALVASTTALTGACPTVFVDLVGYGTTANCQGFLTNLTNAQSAQRKTAGCTDGPDNNLDFEALTPVPRNTASATNSCGGAPVRTDPAMTLAASPSTATVGESVLLTATIVPGANPTSTNLVVLANLSALGGDASQRLRDEGTNGDAVAGDGIFSVAQTVGAVAAGTYSIPVGAADAEDRRDDDSINITVASIVAIHAIQGAGNTSPLAGQTVVTEGIVTARRTSGFFLQAADGEVDADASTSEGVFVYTGGAPSSAATVGNRVRVQGKVAEFIPTTAPHQLALTELTTPVVSLLSTGNALPTVVPLTTNVLRADSLDSMERLEGMRVSADLVVAAPGGGFVNEQNATSTTDGVFYGVLPGVARPMREAGLSVLDATPFPADVTPPLFDSNPERLRVQTTGLAGTTAIAVDVGDTVSGLVGVLDYGFGAYNLMPDTVGHPPIVVAGATPRAVPTPGNDEITVGGFNLLRFFDDVNDPAVGEPVLTATALNKRLRKTANAICKYVKAPDILGVVEVENLSVLQDLAESINTGDTQEAGACASNPQYVAHLLEGNDVGGIDVGFLLRTADVGGGVPRVEVLEIEQLGKDMPLVNPDGTASLLNDRPSLLLRARVHQGNGASRELTVIVNHLRSLSDANSTDAGSNGWSTVGARVRAKRAQQAKYIADVVQARQTANPNELLVLLGDFNAFEFNDGYVDSMGIISGDAAAEGTVLTHVASPVTRPLTNIASLMPESERYSFSFDGNAQSLDHLLVNQAILDAGFGVHGEHARINADFGEDNFGDTTVPVRVSDHDPVVLYLRDPAFATADLAVSVEANDTDVAAGEVTTFGVGVANGGPDAAAPARVALRVDSIGTAFSVVAPDGWVCDAPVADGADGQRIDCGTGTLASGAVAGFAVSVEAPASGGRTLTLRASVDTMMTDPASSNDIAQASVAVIAPVDLAVAVDAGAANVNVGGTATFGVGVANAGANAAQSATLDLVLSAPIAGVQVDAPAGWLCNAPVVAADTRVHCTAATALGQAGFVVRAPVSDALGESRLTLAANVAAATADPDAGNNTASAGIDVEARADLSVRVLAPSKPVKAATPAIFAVNVGNAGPDTARGVNVALMVNAPAHAVLELGAAGWTCSATGGDAVSSRWACARGAFANGASSTLAVKLDGRLAQPAGALRVTAAVAAGSTDANAGNNSATASVKVTGK